MDCTDGAFCGHEDVYSIANNMGNHLVASCFGGAANGKKPLPAQICFVKVAYNVFQQLEQLEYYPECGTTS